MDLRELQESLHAAVRSAYVRANLQGQLARKNLYALSMSGLGGCVRQAAYRLSGTQPTDADTALRQEARPAMHGTWIHEGLLPHLQYFLGEDILAQAHSEMPVRLTVEDVAVEGSTDMYTDAFGGGVVDLKTIYAHGLDHLEPGKPKPEHWWQVAGYATAVAQSGRPVSWVAWLYVDRSTGETLPMVVPFGEEEKRLVVERVVMLATFSRDPQSAPRVNGGGRLMPGPGDETRAMPCNGCPWLRRCFGSSAMPGDPSARAVFIEEQENGVEWAMGGYREASKKYKQAEEDKSFYKSVVQAAQLPPGTYGSYRYTLGKPREIMDQKEAERRMKSAGVPVPKKLTDPSFSIRPAR